MAERSHIQNGRFLQNLANWNASNATYSAGDGDAHYGVAALSTGGGYIKQSFAVPYLRLYNLRFYVKAVGSSLTAGQATLTITDNQGNTVVTANLAGTADTWTVNDFSYGLAPGANYIIRITNVSAAGQVKIDDLYLWFVPKTRQELAQAVHTKLGRLATDRSYSTTASGSNTEGSYTAAVDTGLRTVGAIDDETGLPDVRYLDVGMIDACLDAIEDEMIERLQRDFALEVDITVGPRSEKLSQVAAALGKMGNSGGGGSGSGRVVTKRLIHRAGSYEFE